MSCPAKPIVLKWFLKPLTSDVEHAAGVRVVHTDKYRPVAFDRPESPQNITEYCPHLARTGVRLDNRDWRFCANERASQMRMHVLLQHCALVDRGVQAPYATFDRRSYVDFGNGLRPAFHMQNVKRYPALATGLFPYGAEAASHFWFGTAQYVLTLYDVLPSDVPIVVARSPALDRAYQMLNINMKRLITFDSACTYYADRLYSIGWEPWGRNVQGGEPTSPQSTQRMRKYLRPASFLRPNAEADLILFVSRADRSSRRCTTHAELGQALLAKTDDMLVEFVGSDHTLVEAQRLFARARLVVAPHGGALLNMAFMAPGAGVVEIGYYEPHSRNGTRYKSMRFPPWYFVFAKQLGLRYRLVMGAGSYTGDIECPVDPTARAAVALLQSPQS